MLQNISSTIEILFIFITLYKLMRTTAAVLIGLLILRLFGQIFQIIALMSVSFLFIVPLIFAILYAAALLGIIKQQKWGSILVMVIAGIDLLFALFIGGASGIGAGVVDLILLFLGYKEYSALK